MDLLGRASWVLFAAGAIPTGLAAYLIWRRFGVRLRELERLEMIIERIPDALVITNLRGEVLLLNAAALPLFGASREDVMMGGKDLLQTPDPARWRLRVQDVLKAHTSGGVMELPSAAGGSPMSFRTMVTMFTDPVSGDFGVLMMLRDQTSEKRLETSK